MDPENNTPIDPTLNPSGDQPVTPGNVTPIEQQQQPVIDQGAIAAAAAQAVMSAQQQNAPDPNDPANMTPEQQAEHFRTFNVTEDFVSGFVGALRPDDEGNVPIQQVSQNIEQLRDGILAQSMRHTELAVEQAQAQFQQQFQPIQQQYQQQAATQVWDAYSAARPDHANYKSIVDATASQLSASGFQAVSQEQLFATVAAQVDATLKSVNPAYVPAAPAAPSQSPNPSPNVMTGIAMGQGLTTPAPSNQNTNEFYDPDVLG